LVVDSPHLGPVYRSQGDNGGNGAGRDNGKRPRNIGGNGNGHGGKKPRPSKPENDSKDKIGGKGKGKMRHKRRFDFNAIVKALTPTEQQRHRDEHLFYKYHKTGHRMSKCPMLLTESADKAVNQDGWWPSCHDDGQAQPVTTSTAYHAPLVVDEAKPSTSRAPIVETTTTIRDLTILKAGRREQIKQSLSSRHVISRRLLD
jgi:hypothetical protein